MDRGGGGGRGGHCRFVLHAREQTAAGLLTGDALDRNARVARQLRRLVVVDAAVLGVCDDQVKVQSLGEFLLVDDRLLEVQHADDGAGERDCVELFRRLELKVDRHGRHCAATKSVCLSVCLSVCVGGRERVRASESASERGRRRGVVVRRGGAGVGMTGRGADDTCRGGRVSVVAGGERRVGGEVG